MNLIVLLDISVKLAKKRGKNFPAKRAFKYA